MNLPHLPEYWESQVDDLAVLSAFSAVLKAKTCSVVESYIKKSSFEIVPASFSLSLDRFNCLQR